MNVNDTDTTLEQPQKSPFEQAKEGTVAKWEKIALLAETLDRSIAEICSFCEVYNHECGRCPCAKHDPVLCGAHTDDTLYSCITEKMGDLIGDITDMLNCLRDITEEVTEEVVEYNPPDYIYDWE